MSRLYSALQTHRTSPLLVEQIRTDYLHNYLFFSKYFFKIALVLMWCLHTSYYNKTVVQFEFVPILFSTHLQHHNLQIEGLKTVSTQSYTVCNSLMLTRDHPQETSRSDWLGPKQNKNLTSIQALIKNCRPTLTQQLDSLQLRKYTNYSDQRVIVSTNLQV